MDVSFEMRLLGTVIEGFIMVLGLAKLMHVKDIKMIFRGFIVSLPIGIVLCLMLTPSGALIGFFVTFSTYVLIGCIMFEKSFINSVLKVFELIVIIVITQIIISLIFSFLPIYIIAFIAIFCEYLNVLLIEKFRRKAVDCMVFIFRWKKLHK